MLRFKIRPRFGRVARQAVDRDDIDQRGAVGIAALRIQDRQPTETAGRDSGSWADESPELVGAPRS